jgi:hypothetical protein
MSIDPETLRQEARQQHSVTRHVGKRSDRDFFRIEGLLGRHRRLSGVKTGQR